MCDEFTEADNSSWLARQAIGRRTFGLLGASAAALALMPGCAEADSLTDDIPSVQFRAVTIETPDGEADGFFVYPAEGRYPAILMWPDVAGLRQAYRIMATQLAEAGYAVLVVNQYYRSARAPILNSITEWQSEAGKDKLKPMIAAITPQATTRDAAAFVAWLDAQAEVDPERKIGTCGYCMGGPFTFRTAAVAPRRVGALASFHGGGLVTDKADSPHLLIPEMQAAMLIAIAQNDDARDLEAKTVLREAAAEADLPAEIEVYPAQHGWCTIDAPVYDKVQADKARRRMLAIFTEYL